MSRKLNAKYKKNDLIQRVVEMFANGKTQFEILEWLKTEAELKSVYSYQILKLAKPLLNNAIEDIAKDRLLQTITEMEKFYSDSLKAGDKRLALEIKKEINKISGLHSQTIDITSKGEKIENITTIKIVEIKKEDDKDEEA